MLTEITDLNDPMRVPMPINYTKGLSIGSRAMYGICSGESIATIGNRNFICFNEDNPEWFPLDDSSSAPPPPVCRRTLLYL